MPRSRWRWSRLAFARKSCHPEERSGEGSAFRGLFAPIACNRNNSWVANLRESVANRSVLGLTPRATSRDFFLERHTGGCPAHPKSNHGSLSEGAQAPSVGFVQFVRVIRVLAVGPLGWHR